MAIACSSIPMTVCTIYISAAQARREFKRAFGVALFILAVSLSLVCAVITRYGLLGVGLALCASYVGAAMFCVNDLWLGRDDAGRLGTVSVHGVVAG